MRHWMSSLVLTASLFSTGAMLAAETAAVHGEAADVEHVEHVDAFPHPHISEDGRWAGVMVVIVLGFFLAAAVIGPIVRSETPEEVPPAHSHDEPPGSSGHHGHSGTHAEEPHH